MTMMIGMGLFWLAIILGIVWLVHKQRRDVLTGAAAPHTDQDATALAGGRS